MEEKQAPRLIMVDDEPFRLLAYLLMQELLFSAAI